MALTDLMRSFLGGTTSTNAPAVPASGASAPVAQGGNPAPAGASNNPRGFDNGATPPATGATDPAAPAGATTPPAKSVMEQLEGLWQADPNAKAAPSVTPSLTLDPTKLASVVSQMNFTQGLSPELITKATSGDAAAFSDAINQAAQQAFAQALNATSKITEHALAQQAVSLKTALPTEMKKLGISEALAAENPLFANPTVQPFVTMLRDQLANKYPQASATELNSMAKGFFLEMATEIQKPAEQQRQQQQAATTASSDKSVDWTQFFNS